MPALIINTKTARKSLALLGEKTLLADKRFRREDLETGLPAKYHFCTKHYSGIAVYSAPITDIIDSAVLEKAKRKLLRVSDNTAEKNIYGTPCSDAGWEDDRIVLHVFITSPCYNCCPFRYSFEAFAIHDFRDTKNAAKVQAYVDSSSIYPALQSYGSGWKTELVEKIEDIIPIAHDDVPEAVSGVLDSLRNNFPKDVSTWAGRAAEDSRNLQPRMRFPQFFPKKDFFFLNGE